MKKTKKKQSNYLNRIFSEAKRHLSTSEKALSYLHSRFATEDQISSLNLGYIPEDKWPAYIDESEATEDEKLYWKRSGKGVKLKGKLLFPMTNAMGMIKGFQVRSPDPDVKDYWKFYSIRADIDAVFFGTNIAMPSIWKSREVYLVEGIFDLFPVQNLFPNALCCGTATVGTEQIKFLKRYVDRVHVVFDNDEQGDRFFEDFYYEYRHDFDLIDRVSYAGKDPSESRRRLGASEFQNQFKAELSLDLNSSHSAGPLYRG